MKVAVASGDGVSISHHFGRSANWLIFDVEDGKIAGPEVRPNTHTHHAQSGSGCRDHGSHDGPHSHAAILDAFADCRAVISGGMGWRAAEDLQRRGIHPFVVDCRRTPLEAVAMYLAGELEEVDQAFCRGGSGRK